MRNLVQKVLEYLQMLDVELDQVEVEYLFEHFDFPEGIITAFVDIIPT